MRSVSSNFDASLTQVTTNFARLWTITRQDGVVLRLTDHSADVTVAGNLYSTSTGFTATAALTSSLSMASQTVQLTVPLLDLGVTETELRAGRYANADAVNEIVDYRHPENGTMVMFSGRIGRIVTSDKNRATIEVISQADANLYVAKDSYCQNCRNDLGDSLCKVNIFNLAVDFTVASVTDQTTFVVDTMEGQASDFFALGQIKWLTGDNKLLVSDVLSSNGSTLTIGLFYPMPFNIQVGDTGQLLPGCDKALTTCLTKFDNVKRFRGEPFAPSYE